MKLSGNFFFRKHRQKQFLPPFNQNSLKFSRRTLTEFFLKEPIPPKARNFNINKSNS
jgi:hypothetical protein